MLGLQTIETWLFKNAAAKGLSALLSKLPLDGGKTVLGILFLVLADVAKELPSTAVSPFVGVLIDVVQSLGPDSIQDVGLVAVIVGCVHKVLKFFFPAVKDVVVVPPSSPVVVQLVKP